MRVALTLTVLAISSMLTSPVCAHLASRADDSSLTDFDRQIQEALRELPRDNAVLERVRRAQLGISGVRPITTRQDSALRVNELLSLDEVLALPEVSQTRFDGVVGLRGDFLSRVQPETRERIGRLLARRRAAIERVYGPDDRVPVSLNGMTKRPIGGIRRVGAIAPQDDIVAKCAQATVLLIPSNALQQLPDGSHLLTGLVPFRSKWPTASFCPDAPLLDAWTVTCRCATGFLAGDRTIVTACHVIRGQNIVAHERWLAAVFDFTEDNVDTLNGRMHIPAGHVMFFDQPATLPDLAEDWCILTARTPAPRWNGQVRSPLIPSLTGTPSVGAKVFTVGFPNGSVMTLADDGEVKSQRQAMFSATLDIFGGNSGGAVVGLDGTLYGLVSSAPDGSWASYAGSYNGELAISSSSGCVAPKRALSDGANGDTCVSAHCFAPRLLVR